MSEIRIRRVTAILPGFAMNYIISEDVRGVPSFSRIATRSCGLSSKRASIAAVSAQARQEETCQ